MKKTFLFILSITLMGMFSVMAQTVVPTTSTNGAETWYYMKLVPRDAANPQNTWATVMPDDTLQTTAFTGGDEQLWKVVENGTGVALVNKAKGYYMDVDYSMNKANKENPDNYSSSKIAVTADMPTNSLRFVESTGYDHSGLDPNIVPGWTSSSTAVYILDNEVTEVAGDNTFTFKTTGGAPFSFVLTSYGGAKPGALSIPGWGNGNHNQLVQFRTQEEVAGVIKVALARLVDINTDVLDNVKIGTEPGKFPQELVTALQGNLNAAKAVSDNTESTLEEANAAIENLGVYFSLFAKLRTANTSLANAEVGEELGQYSAELIASLSARIADAQTVLLDENATQADVVSRTEGFESYLVLFSAIERATDLLGSVSVGEHPGQFSSEAISPLSDILLDASNVCIDNASTDEDFTLMAEEVDLVVEFFSQEVTLPQMSTTAFENWYYIQGTRPANSYLTAGEAGAGLQVISEDVIPNDTQLWKLVENGEGFALQNKATGEYIEASSATPSNTILRAQPEMPELPLRFIATTQTTSKTIRFAVENVEGYEPAYRLHAGGASHNWGLMTWTGDVNDNSTWLFLSEEGLFRTNYSMALDAAKEAYENSIEGVEFGQFSAETRATLAALIDAEEAIDPMDRTIEELTAAMEALNEAVAVFESNRDVASLASFTETKWFRIVNNMQPETGYASNKAMSSNGRVVEQKFTFEEIDEDSDEQLFRFELNADKTAVTAIINKGDSLSYYVGVDGMILTEDPAVTFEITSLDAISFWIKPTDAAPLHAAAAGSNILNWNANAGSASAWRIEFVDSEPVTDFITPFQKALANAYTLFEAAAQLQGNKIGQYTEASVQAFSDVITQQEVKDPETMTKEELIAAIEALNAGPDLLSVNSDIKTLVTSDPATHWKWFRLINNQTSGYAAGMAMSSNGRLEEEPFTYEEKNEYSDAQLFRFELNAAETHVASIYNKASELYVDANGKLAAVSTEDNEFEIVQLAEGRSFWIHPTLEALVEESDPEEFLRLAPLHAASAGVHIVNWESGVGSASAWVFEYVETEYLSGLSSLDESKYTVRVNQGVVTVDGVENFEVYSTTGQRQNHKAALNPGVYVIKVENMTKKLVIK